MKKILVLLFLILPMYVLAATSIDEQFVNAAKDGSFRFVKRYLRQGADINATDDYGRTGLYWAAFKNDSKMVAWLIKKGANPNQAAKDGETPLKAATKMGNDAAASVLINLNANVANNTVDIHDAAKNNSAGVIRQIKQKGISIEKRDNLGNTPLITAASYGSIDAARELIQLGANLNAKGQYGYTPLHAAVQYYRTDMIQLLLDSGAKVDSRNDNRETPLILMSSKDRRHKNLTGKAIKTAKQLINAGADINAQDKFKRSALYNATANDYQIGYIEYLIANGADVNLMGYQSPLHNAVNDFEKLHIAKFLLSKNAKVNARNERGMTPAHVALKHNNPGAVILLMDNGLDLKIRDNDGLFAMNYNIYSWFINFVTRKEADEAYGISHELITQPGVEGQTLTIHNNTGANIQMWFRGATNAHLSVLPNSTKTIPMKSGISWHFMYTEGLITKTFGSSGPIHIKPDKSYKFAYNKIEQKVTRQDEISK